MQSIKSLKTILIGYKKSLYFLGFYLLVIILSIISLFIKANFLTYSLITLLPASVYLFWLNKKEGRKIIWPGIFIAFSAWIIFDFFCHFGKAWFVPTIFPWRFLGIPIENLIWLIFYFYIVLGLYEYFYDSSKSIKIPKYHKWFYLFLLTSVIAVLIFRVFLPQIFNISYFYSLFMFGLIIAEAFALLRYKRFASKALVCSFMMIPISFVHEIVSLYNNHWFFEKGNHLAYLDILNFSIPLEEILFFIVAPLAIIIVYEIFLDNRK
jgi:hypothetical protein